MLKNIQAAIFDLDGTLVDSMGIWGNIDKEYLGRHHIPVPVHLQKEVEGLAFTEVAHYFKREFQLSDSIQQIKDDWNHMAEDKYLHEVPLKPGVKNLLSYLQTNHIKMGVASSNSIQLVEAALGAHGIRGYFSSVLTCCDVWKGKPEPDVYLEIAGRLSVKPEDCLAFEDIPVGLMAGKAAGMRTCAVYDDYSVGYEKEKRRLADFYIHSYDEILHGTFEEL